MTSVVSRFCSAFEDAVTFLLAVVLLVSARQIRGPILSTAWDGMCS